MKTMRENQNTRENAETKIIVAFVPIVAIEKKWEEERDRGSHGVLMRCQS